MDIGLREWLVIGGVLVIVLIILDGWRRIRVNRNRLRMDIDRSVADLPEEPERTFNPELPNGGARVAGKSPLFAASYPQAETRASALDEYDPLLSPAPASALDLSDPDRWEVKPSPIVDPAPEPPAQAVSVPEATPTFSRNDEFDELLGPARVVSSGPNSEQSELNGADVEVACDSERADNRVSESVAISVPYEQEREQQETELEPEPEYEATSPYGVTDASLVCHQEAVQGVAESASASVAAASYEVASDVDHQDSAPTVTVVEEELSWQEVQAHEAAHRERHDSFLDDVHPIPELGDLNLEATDDRAVSDKLDDVAVVVPEAFDEVDERVKDGAGEETEAEQYLDEPVAEPEAETPIRPAVQLVTAEPASEDIDLDKPIPIAFDFNEPVGHESEEAALTPSFVSGGVAEDSAPAADVDELTDQASVVPESVQAPAAVTERKTEAEAARSPVTQDLFADRAALEKTPEPDKVLIITVLAEKGREIRGERLLSLVKACGMQFGDMDIFHRFEDGLSQGAVQFSMADAVNPGTFNIDHIERTVTRGLTFFMSMEEPRDVKNAFECMLATAETVAKHMGAELLDENRSVLRPQTKEHYRQRIRDYEMHNRARRPR
jgi:cell division protein ZipA